MRNLQDYLAKKASYIETIGKPAPNKIKDVAIKKLILKTLGTDGSVKLTPDTLGSDMSLRELGATRGDMYLLANRLDEKYKLKTKDVKIPKGWEGVYTPKEASEGFFVSPFEGQLDIDIDTVNKIKKILQEGKAKISKGYRNSYEEWHDKYNKLNPGIPAFDDYYELDDHGGYKFLMPEDYDKYKGPVNIKADESKDAITAGLIEALKKNTSKSNSSKANTLNKYLASKGITSDYDKQDQFIRGLFKTLGADYDPEFDATKKYYERHPHRDLFVKEISKLPINKNGMPETVTYGYDRKPMPFAVDWKAF